MFRPPDAEAVKRASFAEKCCAMLATLLIWLMIGFLQVFPVLVVIDGWRHYKYLDSAFPYPCWFSFGFASTRDSWHGGWLCPIWCWTGPRAIAWSFAALEA